MQPTHRLAAALALTSLFLSSLAGAAQAGNRDADGDGIPNHWERNHGLNPHRAVDARRDFDRDGLSNLREYRLGSRIRDEDTDNDGHDDGDEVKDGFRGSHVLRADTDRDGILDGDEDLDHDGIDLEDEDDADERCGRDDDDLDGDGVKDEDENDHGTLARVADSDDDGILDGDEDSDEDGEADEDEDDADEDECQRHDEDDDDLLGVIESFDTGTGMLTVTSVHGHTVVGVVTDDTEIEIEDADTSGPGSEADEGSPEDLQPGVEVAELEFDDDSGTLEEIEIYLSR